MSFTRGFWGSVIIVFVIYVYLCCLEKLNVNPFSESAVPSECNDISFREKK